MLESRGRVSREGQKAQASGELPEVDGKRAGREHGLDSHALRREGEPGT